MGVRGVTTSVWFPLLCKPIIVYRDSNGGWNSHRIWLLLHADNLALADYFAMDSFVVVYGRKLEPEI